MEVNHHYICKETMKIGSECTCGLIKELEAATNPYPKLTPLEQHIVLEFEKMSRQSRYFDIVYFLVGFMAGIGFWIVVF